MDLNQLLSNLESAETKDQALAVSEAKQAIDLLASKSVQALKTSPNKFLIAERLSAFGSLVVPHLEDLFGDISNTEPLTLAQLIVASELQILASIILLKNGSKKGVSYLLAAVLQDKEYAGLAASYLAVHGIQEAIEAIKSRLGYCVIEQKHNWDLITTLLLALWQLKATLPQQLYDELFCFEILKPLLVTLKPNSGNSRSGIVVERKDGTLYDVSDLQRPPIPINEINIFPPL